MLSKGLFTLGVASRYATRILNYLSSLFSLFSRRDARADYRKRLSGLSCRVPHEFQQGMDKGMPSDVNTRIPPPPSPLPPPLPPSPEPPLPPLELPSPDPIIG